MGACETVSIVRSVRDAICRFSMIIDKSFSVQSSLNLVSPSAESESQFEGKEIRRVRSKRYVDVLKRYFTKGTIGECCEIDIDTGLMQKETWRYIELLNLAACRRPRWSRSYSLK